MHISKVSTAAAKLFLVAKGAEERKRLLRLLVHNVIELRQLVAHLWLVCGAALILVLFPQRSVVREQLCVVFAVRKVCHSERERGKTAKVKSRDGETFNGSQTVKTDGVGELCGR